MDHISCRYAGARIGRALRRRPHPDVRSETWALTLTRAGKSRDGEWSTDDYDVFEGPRLIGHIVLSTQGPQGMPWFWEITARPESTQNRGYAVSCEQAMKELKARWANPARF